MITYKGVKSILKKHKKRDSWFLDDLYINPHEGSVQIVIFMLANPKKIFADVRVIKTNSDRIKRPFNS